MKAVLFGFIAILLSFASCSHPPKLRPEHVGVDPRLAKNVEEFMWLSKQYNITFTRPVTIGFKKIKRGNAVGMCTYGGNWREIDIDIEYWLNNHSSAEKLALLYHELIHCYCTRGHDYGEGKDYPEGVQARIDRALRWLKEGGERPGYWDDGCPTSLMYPVVIEQDCMLRHYHEYIKEMFDRCIPW